MPEYAPPVGIDAACTNQLEGPYAPPKGIDLLCENVVNTKIGRASCRERV